MSVTAVHCCNLVREKKKLICMWAPPLLSYCNPVSVRGRETFSRGELQKHKGLFLFSLHTPSLTCAHHFTLRTKAELACKETVSVVETPQMSVGRCILRFRWSFNLEASLLGVCGLRIPFSGTYCLSTCTTMAQGPPFECFPRSFR